MMGHSESLWYFYTSSQVVSYIAWIFWERTRTERHRKRKSNKKGEEKERDRQTDRQRQREPETVKMTEKRRRVSRQKIQGETMNYTIMLIIYLCLCYHLIHITQTSYHSTNILLPQSMHTEIKTNDTSQKDIHSLIMKSNNIRYVRRCLITINHYFILSISHSSILHAYF